jgi:hypothetical protein
MHLNVPVILCHRVLMMIEKIYMSVIFVDINVKFSHVLGGFTPISGEEIMIFTLFAEGY